MLSRIPCKSKHELCLCVWSIIIIILCRGLVLSQLVCLAREKEKETKSREQTLRVSRRGILHAFNTERRHDQDRIIDDSTTD